MRMGEPTHMLPHFLHHVTVAIDPSQSESGRIMINASLLLGW